MESDPGDSLTSPTTSYTYNNSYTADATTPCLEINTTTREMVGGGQTLTTQQWYDGQGRVVETKAPGPNLLSSVSATCNGTTIWNQTKTYDNVGNTLSLSTTLPTISGDTQTDAQSFCYDGLDRLVWAGNTGTPSGGDHCGSTPSGTTVSTYQQSNSYDVLDRLINGLAGTETYGTTPVHGANTLSTVPNQYASYDAMGNMTCRNVDTTVGSTQSCDASQTGALMSYDNEGCLSSWTAPGASTPSDEILYGNAGHRVLQRISNSSTSSTDTISFGGITDVTINGSQTSYYDPISGRFTSADSVETNASGHDPYGYVKGNPETNTDPTGHALCPMVVASGCGGNPPPPSPPNASSSPIGTGNTGSDGGGNSGVCEFELGCGGGSTTTGSSNYPAGGASNPNPPM